MYTSPASHKPARFLYLVNALRSLFLPRFFFTVFSYRNLFSALFLLRSSPPALAPVPPLFDELDAEGAGLTPAQLELQERICSVAKTLSLIHI